MLNLLPPCPPQWQSPNKEYSIPGDTEALYSKLILSKIDHINFIISLIGNSEELIRTISKLEVYNTCTYGQDTLRDRTRANLQTFITKPLFCSTSIRFYYPLKD